MENMTDFFFEEFIMPMGIVMWTNVSKLKMLILKCQCILSPRVSVSFTCFLLAPMLLLSGWKIFMRSGLEKILIYIYIYAVGLDRYSCAVLDKEFSYIYTYICTCVCVCECVLQIFNNYSTTYANLLHYTQLNFLSHTHTCIHAHTQDAQH